MTLVGWLLRTLLCALLLTTLALLVRAVSGERGS